MPSRITKITLRISIASAVLLMAGLNALGKDLVIAPGVSPSEELEILDPQVDPEGKPRPLVLVGSDGLQRLEVPPTIIVHKHYYTGDRDFQGPMLQGGPVLLSVNSPANNERISVEVQLPPGAPRVYYRRDVIAYEFRDIVILVDLGKTCVLSGKSKPSVTLIPRSPKSRQWERHLEAKHEFHQEWFRSTGIQEATVQAKQHCQHVVVSTAELARKTGQFVVNRVDALKSATPLAMPTSVSPAP